MQNENFKKQFQEKLSEQLREHRIKQNYSQVGIANAVGVALHTYQRWESRGQHLTDIFRLLKVFRELKFSTAEIIDVLGIPPLTLNEVEDLYQDENTLKSIKENSVCSAMREKCPDIDDFTLAKLLEILMKEYLKRFKHGHKNT